jgi:hypothetical protein
MSLTKVSYSTITGAPVNILDYGADPTGVADSSAAITAALAAGKNVIVPTGTYKVNSTITIPQSCTITGEFYTFNKQSDFPKFVGAPGITVFDFPAAELLVQIGGNAINGVVIEGGAIGLRAPNGLVGLTLNNVQFLNCTSHGISGQGFNQEWFFNDVTCYGCNFFIDSATGTGGTGSLLDKCAFYNLYVTGSLETGIDISALLSNSVLFSEVRSVFNIKNGFRIAGGVRGWTVINYTTESNGYLGGSAPVARITGTGTAGVASIVVSSTTGYAAGDSLTIAGAGTDGQDLTASISSIVGMTFNLGTNILTSVTDADITKYTYSDLVIESVSGGIPAVVTFIGGQLGIQSALAGLKYAADVSQAGEITFLNCQTTLPIYSQYGNNVNLFSGSLVYRSPNNYLYELFTSFNLGNAGNRTQIVSPLGNDIVLGLKDSNGDATGTFGDIIVKKLSPNRDTLLSLAGEAGPTAGQGLLSAAGGMSPGFTDSIGGFGLGGNKVIYGASIPTVGLWYDGDIVFNTGASSGGYVGWVCIAQGTPGTWKTFGAISA